MGTRIKMGNVRDTCTDQLSLVAGGAAVKTGNVRDTCTDQLQLSADASSTADVDLDRYTNVWSN